MSATAPDPFDACACGHPRRCHDSRGCGKWVEAYVKLVYTPNVDFLRGLDARMVAARTCPCAGFDGVRP